MTNNKIKVAEIIGDAKTGGVISCVFNYFKNMDRNKFQVDFYFYSDSPYKDEIEKLGGNVFTFPKVFNIFKSIAVLKKYFALNNYDIVHAHMTTLSFVPLLAAKLAGIKSRICHAHSMTHKDEKLRHVVKIFLRPLSKIFANYYAGCCDASIKWLYGKKCKNTFLLHNAIDLNKFEYNNESSLKLKEKYNIGNSKVIGFIGRFVRQKNLHFLLDSFNELIKIRSDVKLVMVGSGKQEHELKEIVNSYNIQDKVLFIADTDKVADYYSMFDLFILPSLYEGLPLVAVEAQTNGLKCLLSDTISDEVNVSKTCSFLPITDPKIWANAMNNELNIITRFDSIDIIANAGYDIEKETKKLEDYYERCTNNVNN